MIKTFLIAIAVLISISGSSQNNTDCWQCISASENKDTELTIKECSTYIDIYKSGKSVDVAKYILARTNMEIESFNNALFLLSSIKTNSSFFSPTINSLQGDCYLELGGFKKSYQTL